MRHIRVCFLYRLHSMPGGGLMQLVALDEQDARMDPYAKEDPWRPSSRYAHEPIRLNFNNPLDFGMSAQVQITRNGDQTMGFQLHVRVPELPAGHRWVPYLGNALIKSVELVIGGVVINRLTGELINILTHLRNKDLGVYHRMIGHVPEMHTSWKAKKEKLLIVPLDYVINEDIPLISLQYHEVRVNVELEKLENLVQLRSDMLPGHPDLHLKDVFLMGEYIYLDTEERRHMAQNQHEYLVEQHQMDSFMVGQQGLSQWDRKRYSYWVTFVSVLGPCYLSRWIRGNIFGYLCETSVSKDDDMDKVSEFNNVISFNHPSLEFIMVVDDKSESHFQSLDKENDMEPCPSLWGHCSAVDDLVIGLNGYDRFESLSKEYLTYFNQHRYHTGTFEHAYILPWVKDPERVESVGGFNCSRIDKTHIAGSVELPSNGQVEVRVYSVSKNLLRVQSGMAGVAFSN